MLVKPSRPSTLCISQMRRLHSFPRNPTSTNIHYRGGEVKPFLCFFSPFCANFAPKRAFCANTRPQPACQPRICKDRLGMANTEEVIPILLKKCESVTKSNLFTPKHACASTSTSMAPNAFLKWDWYKSCRMGNLLPMLTEELTEPHG